MLPLLPKTLSTAWPIPSSHPPQPLPMSGGRNRFRAASHSSRIGGFAARLNFSDRGQSVNTSRLVGGISQKMLTQTVRPMERDGLLERKVYPVVPPKVEYKLTDLGLTLSAAFCGVWLWAAGNLSKVEEARARFDKKARTVAA